MRRKLPSLRMGAIVVGVLLLSTTVALASPGSGFTAGPQTGGTVDGKFNLNIDGFINLHTKGDLRVVDQVITIGPGGYVGWHSHPGPVLVVVKSGTFRSVQTDCSYTDYTAGEVYVDEGAGHVHNAVNPGSVNTEISITYLAPTGVPLRQEADAITC
jgi:quercetin dioxygenase-like cupin family protein